MNSNSDVFKKVFTWICLWLSIVAGSIYLLKLVGADQYHRFAITSGYFSLFALFGVYYYRIKATLLHHATFTRQLFLILLTIFCASAFCLLIDRLMPLNPLNLSRIMRDGFYFPLFRYETIITKMTDITFQQVFIFALISELKKLNLENKKIITIFSSAFFLIHLPLVLSLGWVAFYFIVPCIFAGAIFSYLILNLRYGLSLSFIVHLFFYVLIGLYLRQ